MKRQDEEQRAEEQQSLENNENKGSATGEHNSSLERDISSDINVIQSGAVTSPPVMTSGQVTRVKSGILLPVQIPMSTTKVEVLEVKQSTSFNLADFEKVKVDLNALSENGL